MENFQGDASKAGKTLSELGASKGGKARAKSLSKEERQEIARKAAETRWAAERKNPPPLRSTHEGTLKIGETSIPCAVLDNGQRILSEHGITTALGSRSGAAKRRKRVEQKDRAPLPVFVASGNIEPFISNELRVGLIQPVNYWNGKRMAHGYPAELLPKICDVWLAGRDAGVIHKQQEGRVKNVEMLMRGLAHVGIIALVDEATGYQEVRDRMALQAILDAFLRKELAAWASRFPNEFYHELFRLRGWNWESKSGHRPRQAGKDTKNIVYSRLAPGILEELEKKNPPNQAGYRKARHHQWLTEDIGHPALAQHLHAVIAFMRVSKDWDKFKRMLDQAFPKRGDTLRLPFMADSTHP